MSKRSPAPPTYRRAANGRFYAFWSTDRRSFRQSLGTEDADQAQLRFAHFLLQHKADNPPEDAELTVADLWSRYFSEHVEKRCAAVDAARYRWKNLQVHFGALKISRVTQESVEAYERLRLAGKIGRVSAPGGVRNEICYLKSCLRWAAHPRRKLIAKADLPDFAMPDAHKPRDRWLRLPEVERLLAAATAKRGDDGRLTRVERFLWLALETAARRKAIEELTWDRVDLEAGLIHYNVPGAMTTKKRRGSPPISKALRRVLERAHRERLPDSVYVLDRPTTIYDQFRDVVAAAGMEKVSPHTLRHTAATHMARRGVPIATIADILANSVAICDRVYRHHCNDAARAAVEHISGGLLEAAE